MIVDEHVIPHLNDGTFLQTYIHMHMFPAHTIYVCIYIYIYKFTYTHMIMYIVFLLNMCTYTQRQTLGTYKWQVIGGKLFFSQLTSMRHSPISLHPEKRDFTPKDLQEQT